MRCRRGLFLLDIRLLALRQGIVQELFWSTAVYAMSCRIHHCVQGQLIDCQLQCVWAAGAACLVHCSAQRCALLSSSYVSGKFGVVCWREFK